MADYSRLERQRPGKLSHRTSTAAYGAQPETMTKLNVGEVEPQWYIASDIIAWLLCLLDTLVSSAETAELIEVPFRLWIPVGPKNHILNGGSDSLIGRDTFGGCCGLLLALLQPHIVCTDAARRHSHA